jgi:hypothetical protein
MSSDGSDLERQIFAVLTAVKCTERRTREHSEPDSDAPFGLTATSSQGGTEQLHPGAKEYQRPVHHWRAHSTL